ncbi:MAG: hypothetical protein FD159_664 [Syntrophaceae bacterium]|nr:MAG: hypothetical protein FD159_664 [Syntrophaceae bacterium]
MLDHKKLPGIEEMALSRKLKDPSAFSLQPKHQRSYTIKLSRLFVIGMLMILCSGLLPTFSVAQDLLEGTEFSKQYLVQLSGTVMNETFSGAQALLTLMPPAPGSNNPYQLIIQGFPKKNSRNSFFWNSENSEMTAIANEITCDIKRTFIKPVPMHFIFLSPELLRHSGALAAKAGDEGKKLAESVALPTLINARAGKLKLRIQSNSVSGTVWMKGYDPVEKAFVLYSARLYGQKSNHLQPRQDVKKSTGVGE